MSSMFSTLSVLAVAVLAAAAAVAQPGPGAGPGASAPQGRMGMGPGPGASAPRGGMRQGPRFGADVTPGWAMMTPEERAAHQKAMSEAKTYDDCAALRDQHHQQMVDRAKDKGQTLPAQRRRDVCAGLKK